MKVTANIPDEIVEGVQEFSGGGNITISIMTALKEWLYAKRIKSLNETVTKNPLSFKERFSTQKIRGL